MTSQDLKQVALNKALAISIFVAIALPALTWWAVQDYEWVKTWDFWKWELSLPIAAAACVFLMWRWISYCRSCKCFWCFRPIGEIQVSEGVVTAPLRVGNKIFRRYRTAIEWECNECHMRKLFRKTKIIQEEVQDGSI